VSNAGTTLYTTLNGSILRVGSFLDIGDDGSFSAQINWLWCKNSSSRQRTRKGTYPRAEIDGHQGMRREMLERLEKWSKP